MRKTLSRYRLTALTPRLPGEGQLLALPARGTEALLKWVCSIPLAERANGCLRE